MRKKRLSRSAFFNLRALLGFSLFLLGVVLTLFAFELPVNQSPAVDTQNQATGGRRPLEMVAVRAARSFDGDLRRLQHIPPIKKERPEREPPPFVPRLYQPANGSS